MKSTGEPEVNRKFNLDRRAMLQGGAAGAIAGAAALSPFGAALAQPAQGTKLYIMGTQAGPSVGGPRYQTCYAVVVGKNVYVMDCGYGATEQLVRAGLKLPDIRNIYISHIHPDHTADLSALIYFSWYAGKESTLGIYGPTPMKQIVGDTVKALHPSIDIWLDDIGHKPLEPIDVHEFTAGGPVMQDENVKVTCCLVNHPPVVPALGYRFDTADRSIAFSGDTTPVEALAQLAKGCDILVHESIYADSMRPSTRSTDARAGGETAGSSIAGDAEKLYQHVVNSHTKPEDAGRIAQEAGVKTLVIAHIAPIPPAATEMMYIEKARTTFSGEVIVAHDLMVL
jgi:ribonuclease BN (tRNA processing enzyme)